MTSPGAHVRTVSVGGIQEVATGQRMVTTGIFKRPVTGPVRASGVNLAGDDQADRAVHGGPFKAVYAFPAEHYPSWREAFPAVEFADGAFGENLTTVELLEDGVHVGDRFRCGSCELTVTQPRMPCFKLGIRLGHKGAIKRMLVTGHTGFYFTISAEGELRAGDALELVERLDGGLPVATLTAAYVSRDPAPDQLRAILEAPGVIDEWRDWARSRLDAIERPG